MDGEDGRSDELVFCEVIDGDEWGIGEDEKDEEAPSKEKDSEGEDVGL